MTADELAGRVGAKRIGREYRVTCPAHPDQHPSLDFTDGDTGIVFTCRSRSCPVEAIVAAWGLTMADVCKDAPTRKSTIVATYHYCDEHGVHLFDVVRRDPKGFAQRRADGAWRMDGVRRVPYHLDQLQGQSVLYVTEGERDADRLWALGLPATTNAGGAGKWRDDYTQQLVAAGVQKIVVLPDHDDPGRAHAAQVASSCHAAGLQVKVITLPDLPEKGDVSDWLAAGHTRADLTTLVKAAPIFTPPATETSPSPLRLTRLSTVAAESIDWIWPGRLARGKKTLVAGDPGLGKSRVTFDMAARITRGSAWPDGGTAPRGTVLFLLAEDGLADTVRPTLETMGADLDRVVILEGITEGEAVRPINLARDLAHLAAAITEVQPVLVVIDPITAYLGKVDSYKDAEVRGLLAPLLATIAAHRTALCTVAHLAKDQTRSALHRPGGSIGFVAAARLAFVLAPDPQDSDRRILATLKSNICRPAPSLAFRLPEGLPIWEAGAVALDAETLLRPARPDEDGTDAERVVRDLIADPSIWPLDAKEALTTGAAQGIHERTLRRAARGLGVEMKRLGFGKQGHWVWHRPAIPDTAPSSLSAVSPMSPMQKPQHIEDNNNIEDTLTCTSGEDDREVI